MTDPFDAALQFVLRWEGGRVSDPADPGGATAFGLTHTTIDEAVAQGLLPQGTTVDTITLGQTAVVYRTSFWDRVHGDDLPPSLATSVFDSAVNSGPVQAVKWLQHALSVAEDGVLGPQTLAAVSTANVPVVIQKMLAARIVMLAGLPTFGRYGSGWVRRVVALAQETA